MNSGEGNGKPLLDSNSCLKIHYRISKSLNRLEGLLLLLLLLEVMEVMYRISQNPGVWFQIGMMQSLTSLLWRDWFWGPLYSGNENLS